MFDRHCSNFSSHLRSRRARGGPRGDAALRRTLRRLRCGLRGQTGATSAREACEGDLGPSVRVRIRVCGWGHAERGQADDGGAQSTISEWPATGAPVVHAAIEWGCLEPSPPCGRRRGPPQRPDGAPKRRLAFDVSGSARRVRERVLRSLQIVGSCGASAVIGRTGSWARATIVITAAGSIVARSVVVPRAVVSHGPPRSPMAGSAYRGHRNDHLSHRGACVL